MTLATYLLYVAAVALLIVTPGLTMLMCMTNSINHGPRQAMTSVAGAVTAVLCVMVLSALGLGALLATSETAFTTAKVVGAAYLAWLGIKTFRSNAVLRIEFTVLTLCVLGVTRLMPLLRTSGPVRWINRICGGLFALMGGLLLLTRRSA